MAWQWWSDLSFTKKYKNEWQSHYLYTLYNSKIYCENALYNHNIWKNENHAWNFSFSAQKDLFSIASRTEEVSASRAGNQKAIIMTVVKLSGVYQAFHCFIPLGMYETPIPIRLTSARHVNVAWKGYGTILRWQRE